MQYDYSSDTEANVECLLSQADTYFDQRDWDSAITCYRAAMAADPAHPAVRPLLVDTLYRRAHAHPEVKAYAEETLAACADALEFDPECITATHFQMRLLQDQGEQVYRLHEGDQLYRILYAVRAIARVAGGEAGADSRATDADSRATDAYYFEIDPFTTDADALSGALVLGACKSDCPERDAREMNVLEQKAFFLQSVLRASHRLMAAYRQETLGEPICWDGYLTCPID